MQRRFGVLEIEKTHGKFKVSRMRTRTLDCDHCGREAISDDISDGAYLYTQYGWAFHRVNDDIIFSCPVCEHGEVQGTELLNQIEEIRKLRIEHNAAL